MKNSIEEYIREVDGFKAGSPDQLEEFRIRFLSKKGLLADLFEQFRQLPANEKKETGMLLNTLKVSVQNKIEAFREEMEHRVISGKQSVDLTLPADFMEPGSRHPLSLIRSEIIRIFANIGFTVAEGPEIESDWYNFSALNFPPEHPARDMQDTFFIEKNPDVVLRTHTSSVQVRVMEKQKPPIRSIFPGRVFRNEAISARAHCIFHQVEGLYIDKDVSFADLKQTLLYFAREMFGPDTQIRLRPSYFPFTEPSAEMDISCNICKGEGCNICKHTGWVEILGCGMVDPAVLQNCGIDPAVYSGYAFGMGIERVTMLNYLIRDIRLYFENDLRFLKQFVAAY